MEIPVLQRLTDFEKASLQNPKLFSSYVFSSASLKTFFTWTALILLPLIASLTAIFKSLLLRFKAKLPHDVVFYDSDFSDDTLSVSSFSEEEEDEAPLESPDDYRVRGSDFYLKDRWQNRNLRRRKNGSIGDLFSLSEFIDGRNVVKLWGNSAEEYWDNRVRSSIPGILSEWKPMLGRIVGGGNQRVYVRDDVTGKLTVGDVRMPGKSLEDADVDTWWDADAVIVGDGSERVFDNSDL